MNEELLLKHFDRISEAPRAIPRLRQFILDLAVRGKLVEQDRRDKAATDILNAIRAESRVNGNKSQAGNGTPLPPVDSSEAPFTLPSGWTWARFAELGAFGRGKSKHRPRNDPALFDGGTHFFIQTGDVARSKGNIKTYTNKYNDLGLAQSRMWPTGTLCITIAANIADSGILSFDACFPDSIVGFVPASVFPNARYFEYFIRTAKANLLEFAPATAQKNINLDILNSVLIPLPPLAEQRRIVDRVDELMELCDRLQAAQIEQGDRRHNLGAVALRQLSTVSKEEAAQPNIRFCLEHLGELTRRPEQIADLRVAILSLAVRGRLVRQDSSGESALELLKRVEAEKLKRIQEGSLRKERPLPPVPSDAVPFEVPPTWIWARIGSCALLTEYGTSVRADEGESGVPVLAMGNIQGGRVILDERKKVRRDIEDLPQLFLKRLDLLYNRTNSAELVGKTGIYLGEDDAYTFASYLIRIRFLGELTNPVYVNIAMNSPYFRPTQIIPELRQQCGQANVNGTKLRSMLLPLPPLAEQERIVAKVEGLMALCDQLETQLLNMRSQQGGLLEAVLCQSLSDTHEDTSAQKASNG